MHCIDFNLGFTCLGEYLERFPLFSQSSMSVMSVVNAILL